MRARTAIVFAFVAFAGGARCTAFIAAELSSDQASDSGSTNNDSGNPTTLGGCFDLTNNPCGTCIASACEKPNSSPPVSLEQICNIDQDSFLISDVQSCTQNPYLENCQELFLEGGTYASSISTSAAAENNLQKCINDHCVPSCAGCPVSVPTCGGNTIDLTEAGACGACLANAMNLAGSPCQPYVLQGGCSDDPAAIAQCAPPSGQCTAPDCSGLQTPDQDLDDAGFGLYACLWQQCQGSCPNP